MRVVFLEDVEGVARGGEVKEVKNGFARNYLIPQNLAAPATHNNLQRIKKLSSQASITRVQRLEDMQELATALEGTQVNIEMRAGVNNRLYGSGTGTMVADAVAVVATPTVPSDCINVATPTNGELILIVALS